MLYGEKICKEKKKEGRCEKKEYPSWLRRMENEKKQGKICVV
jgi:hypothetical protein